MPELPEVEHVCRYLRARALGARIRAVTHLDAARAFLGPGRRARPDAFARALAGARIGAIERRAKLVLIGLEDGRTLVVHLMMTGKLWVDAASRPPERATRAIFALEGGPRGARALRFEDQRKFGWIALVSAAERAALLAEYGPDALEAPEEAIAAAYAARRGRAKAALLDQRVVAGIGNIYADEILFEARVHPAARLESLASRALGRLARATREVMAGALARRRGEPVPDQERVGAGRRGVAARLGPQVYQRTGEPCPRCGLPIGRIVLAGRATHFCPHCQRR
jgi:formamidopyrimidine-DNA glycosylase